MTDTPPDVEARMATLLAARSGSDRVRMISDMFEFARTLIVANIRANHRAITDAELRALIFDRTYGDDFDRIARDRIVARLSG